MRHSAGTRVLVALLLSASPAIARAATVPIRTCNSLSLARPGFGVAYRGAVRNDDYRLSLLVPAGLTGWGAAPDAPFHGFTIFLPSANGQGPDCIFFEVHLRVAGIENPQRPTGHKVMLGKATGWRREAEGTVSGTRFSNVTIRFAAAHDGEIDDGEITLVTTAAEARKNVRIFDQFVSSIRFDP